MTKENTHIDKCERCHAPITRNPGCTHCLGQPRYIGGGVGSMPRPNKNPSLYTFLLCDNCITDFWGTWMKRRATIIQAGHDNTQIAHIGTLNITH